MTPEDDLVTRAAARRPEEPPSTLIIYMAVLFAAWLLYLLARPASIGVDPPAWVPFLNNLPGFVIALLLAEGLYRRSRFVWMIGILLGAVSIVTGFLNESEGGNWAAVFTGGQAIIGAIQIVLLLLPPTRHWVRGPATPATE